MNRCIPVWLGLCVVAASVAQTSAPAPKAPRPAAATLRWNNGESIPGEIIGGTASELVWKSPAFEEPLVIRWSALRRIDRVLPHAPSEEPFTVRTRDGSVVHGDLASVTESTVTLRSARHGEIILKREELLSLARAKAANLLFAGPVADRGWRSPAPQEGQPSSRTPPSGGPPTFEEGSGGSLILPYWNSDAALELPLPERVWAEFRVTSSARPDFQISLDADRKQRLRIETWDDELVLTAVNQFKRIRKIDEKERVIALRVLWDRTARRCSIYSPEGELISEWQVPEEPEAPIPDNPAQKKSPTPPVLGRSASREKTAFSKAGIVLRGKGRDLTLEYLKVRTWDGQSPVKIELNQPRIELADGRTMPGEITTMADGNISVRYQQEPEQSFPLADVESIVFAAKAPELKEREVRLAYADGTLLSGRPVSITENRITLETAFSQQPLVSAVDGIRKMIIRAVASEGTSPERALSDFDKLVSGQTTLHGTFTGAGDASPRWQPVGSAKPVTPVQGRDAEIIRAFPPGTMIEPAPALFYLETGDVIPGKLRGIDPSGVELDSEIVEVKRLSGASVNAVQFGAATRAKFDGFEDPGWQVVKGTDETVRRTRDSLHMEPGTAIGHPSALFATEVKFSMKSQNYGCVRLKLFCAGTDGSKASNLILMPMGSRLTAGMEDREGQFDNENQVAIRSGQPIRIKLLITERHVALVVNGYQMQKYPIDPSKRAGAGLMIESASMWGNTVRPIDLMDFSASSEIGKTWLPDIAPETKARALTVPRFRKDDAPRHALLAANGDVLRGQIEAVTGSHFGFRSGLENLPVPRDRVKAAIWLKKPDAEAPIALSGHRVTERLSKVIMGRHMYSGAPLSSLTEFLKRQDPELKFKLPKKQDNRSFEMSFGGQSIGDALDEICSLFGVRYRIEDDGTIALESGTQPQGEMVQRSYWLKTDAFKHSTVRDVLAAKGVLLPAGANVYWRQEARQLSATNTADNHKKLLQILETEFGGTHGSPTHWLSLTSGAGFALIIDQFAEDAVIGHHPVYGRCRVPIQDIHTIRTSMPEASETIKSIADWRLVFAPEPVLPETPGESSPLLGKAAKAIKLPLLGGGEFELAKEQGKVIILDFWATWCGPCIKSLPGLIDAVSKLPADRVKLIGLNQGEPPEQVKQFIETRRWPLTVALDSSQTVGRAYGVEGIPFTVIVGPDGKVAWVHTGYTPEGEVEVTKVVEQLLSDSPR